MPIVIALLLLSVFSCGPAEKADAAASTPEPPPLQCVSDWKPIGEGIDYRMLNCDAARRRFDLHLVRVDPKRATIDALVRPNSSAEAVAGEGWSVAVNANFFDEQFRPLGVVVSAGKEVKRRHPVSWQSVFVVTRDRRPHIVRAMEWESVRDEAVAAAQAGPRLIVSGQKNEVARADPDWRSGVCVDGGQAIFFATPQDARFDVHQMVALAAKMGCDDAMLFDGGPSTQLFVKGAADVDGDKNAPVYVVAKSGVK